MDWFEQIAGFKELAHTSTQTALQVDGRHLINRADGRRHDMGQFELASLKTLRERAGTPRGVHNRLRMLRGDVRELHRLPAHAGAVFQVASQFNMLEMVGPEVSPEQGATRYQHDATQGPACAMAAGAATIYRNYLVPVAGEAGQTADRQLDGLALLGQALAADMGWPLASLWRMRNGYALFEPGSVSATAAHLLYLNDEQRDAYRRLLQIGVHAEVDVSGLPEDQGQQVTQVLCSALPVAYNRLARASTRAWEPLALLVLEAAYEATLCVAAAQAQRGRSSQVLLTLLGGGAFGNEEAWILQAIRRAMMLLSGHGLDVVTVSHGQPSAGLQALVAELG